MRKILPLLIATLLFMSSSLTAQTAKNQWKGAPFKLSTSNLQGDVNGDGIVTVTDVMMLVKNILGNTDNSFMAVNADINHDGNFTVTDVMGIVAIILKGSGSSTDNTPQAFLTCPDDHHPHMIDLGLPSGIKWACCNIGANEPEGYGGYYAWGETEEKDLYEWSNYTHCNGTFSTCYDLGLDIARTQYDVAYVKWGSDWEMPSYDLILELLDNCTSEWTTLNDINGRKFTSKVNGGSIFLPAAGGFWTNFIFEFGASGDYWSSTRHQECVTGAYFLAFYSVKADWAADDNKYEGRSVRPVTNITVIPPIYLSSSTLSLYTGDEESVKIASGSGNYTVKSNDESIATAAVQGAYVHVTGKRSGNVSVTVTDTRTGQTAVLNVIVDPSYIACPDDHHPHIIDLGLPSGTKWACCNVGAAKPYEAGGYFSWGETEEKAEYNNVSYLYSTGEDLGGDGWYDDYYGDTDEFGVTQYLGDDIAGTQYDVAHVKWKLSWLMPSIDQFRELVNNCTNEWTTQNGVYGRRFTSTLNEGSIFLPVTGIYFGKELSGTDAGCYWSSSQDPTQPGYASDLYFRKDVQSSLYGNDRYMGISVRPIWIYK